LYGTELNP